MIVASNIEATLRRVLGSRALFPGHTVIDGSRRPAPELGLQAALAAMSALELLDDPAPRYRYRPKPIARADDPTAKRIRKAQRAARKARRRGEAK